MWKLIISIVLLGSLGGGIFLLTQSQPKKNAQNMNSASSVSSETIASSSSNSIPLPRAEDIVRLFFNLISEKRIPDAIAMMSKAAVPDDAAKQAWGVQFNSIKNLEIVRIEEFEKEKMYKVRLRVEVNPDSANAPIPYYGWENGENIRFVGIGKNTEGKWNIESIGTGP